MESILADLADARARTLELTLDLDDAQWMGPRLAIVNPLRWELAHVAWFQELWVLRRRQGAPPLLANGDALYDSARVPHDARWSLPLLSREETLAYMREVAQRVAAAARAEPTKDDASAYFYRLALHHEDMHDEALTYTRQTLAYARPRFALESPPDPRIGGGPLPGDVDIPGGRVLVGALPRDAGGDEPFVFDNEKWAHPVDVAPFRIARAAVTNEEFGAFVDAGGYDEHACWSEDGWRWRSSSRRAGSTPASWVSDSSGARHPVYWERSKGGAWCERRYDAKPALAPHRPVIHVSWFEAEAYCAWAGRRLPTEAEWELAASGNPGDTTTRERGGDPPRRRRFPWGDAAPTPLHANLDGRAGGPVDVGALPEGDSAFGCRQMIGNAWEWTASDFAPYPGFVIDPYAEYSAPWFASPHDGRSAAQPGQNMKVLRGGCWATRARLLRNTWRNFYPPDRRDVFAGFRTCAREPA